MLFCRMILIISFSRFRGKRQVEQNYPLFFARLSLWENFPLAAGALPDFFCCRQRFVRPHSLYNGFGNLSAPHFIQFIRSYA